MTLALPENCTEHICSVGGWLTAAFDEMNGTGSGVREPYASVHQWLQTQKIDDLKSKRMESINADLQKTRHELEEAAAKLTTANQLVDEATILAPRLALEREDTSLRKPAFSILRKVDGRNTQIPADQNTDLQPGDVVRVDITSSRPSSELLQPRDQAAQEEKAARATVGR